MKYDIPCERCYGSGLMAVSDLCEITCPVCHGTGEREIDEKHLMAPIPGMKEKRGTDNDSR
jgi:DnaJ-class molecular chaperone